MVKTGPDKIASQQEKPYMLTPKAGPAPRLNHPARFGARSGRPFVYRIPCTGERPINFDIEDCPDGVELDHEQGIMRGRVPTEVGRYTMTIHAKNSHGSASSRFELMAGDTLALTPPMGWNSWNAHYDRVTESHVRDAADAMIATGMADFGYAYVNVDDCWMKKRGDQPYRAHDGAILTNSKFPDMRGMVEHIHQLGLRAGIYTSPGPWTCAGYVGAWQHEAQDARTFADWGFDFLKYDWCSYVDVATGEGREYHEKPYRMMGEILKSLDRDIVFNLCQYGRGDVWEWGGAAGGNCWRTTGDIGLEPDDVLPSFYGVGLSNARHWKHARPGEWNDPDYLVLGCAGAARGMGEAEPVTLTPCEQYAYMSMWCLMAAPLFLSSDMTRLDEFTLNILCNHEVIAIDQDPLGRQAHIVRQTKEELVLAKPMVDGSLAVGLFNLAPGPREMSISLNELRLVGPQAMRDPWRQTDLGVTDHRIEAVIPRHGVHLVRLRPAE